MDHDCTPRPDTVTISPGGAVAVCLRCGHKWGLWDCACDFNHECEDD